MLGNPLQEGLGFGRKKIMSMRKSWTGMRKGNTLMMNSSMLLTVCFSPRNSKELCSHFIYE